MPGLSERNPMWKGDNVGYNQLHKWVRTRLIGSRSGLTQFFICQSDGCQRPAAHVANITGVYNRDLNNWRLLCIKCHYKLDKRLHKSRTTVCPDCKSSGIHKVGMTTNTKHGQQQRYACRICNKKFLTHP